MKRPEKAPAPLPDPPATTPRLGKVPALSMLATAVGIAASAYGFDRLGDACDDTAKALDQLTDHAHAVRDGLVAITSHPTVRAVGRHLNDYRARLARTKEHDR